ncbi:MAG: hypothetical protein QW514_10240 [Thermoprotei archaeon]
MGYLVSSELDVVEPASPTPCYTSSEDSTSPRAAWTRFIRFTWLLLDDHEWEKTPR